MRVVDDVLGKVVAEQILVGRLDRLETLFAKRPGLAGGDLLAGLDNDFAGVGVDQVADSLEAAETLDVERNAPVVAGALVGDLVVEGRQDLFAVHAERHQQRRHRNLAAAVDAGVHDVLGIELDVEPRAAIGNDARGKQKLARRVRLALVMVEEDARRTVHLRDDDALGAVDDEGAVQGHERHVAHVDVLLLDVLDRLRAGILVDIEHDEAQRHLQRRGIGQVALTAFVNVEFRSFELVLHELQHRGAGKIGDREDRLENSLQSLVRTPALGLVHHQELVIGCLLNLDQVRHLRNFRDLSEELAYASAAIESLGLGHRRSLALISGRASPRPALHTEPPRRRLSVCSPSACRRPAKTGENPFPEGRSRPSGKRFSYVSRYASSLHAKGVADGARPPADFNAYFRSTLAPAASSWALNLSASALETPSLTGFGAAFDQVLGFLEAKTGDGADFLDDVDLLSASVGEDDVEFRLFLGRSSSSGSAASSGNRHRSSSRNAPLFFQKLRQLGRLEDGQLRKVVYDLCEISHCCIPS